jgi:predicted nucleotidyltransferase
MRESGDSADEVVDLEGLRAYLVEADIEFAILFGSHARGTAEASSDIDVALGFSSELDDITRFRRRNRIDADLQEYADGFVDVSDIESLPTHVAHAALQDGILLVGDGNTVDSYREEIEAEYTATADEREREREEFIDRLARGDV